MPNFVERFLNWRDQRKAPDIKLYEDEEVIGAIRQWLFGYTSEADVATRRHRRKARRRTRAGEGTLIPNIVHDIKILQTKERTRRLTRPAALRQLSICYPELGVEHWEIPTVQLVPERRHASSGFPYPSWLEQYGVSREHWSNFVSRIGQANRIRPCQYALLSCITIPFEVFAIASFPTKFITGFALTTLPLYFYLKRRNLRGAVTDGHIPIWTAAWNKTYFGPKGLCVGFDLPGPVFEDTFVHPKRKLISWRRVLHGPLKKPMSATRAARRSRITIARVCDPMPGEGRVPRIEPLHVPKVQRLVSKLVNRPARFIAGLEKKANERMAIIEALRTERALIVLQMEQERDREA